MAAQHSRYGDYSTRYRFNGKEQDQATGFYYYGACYYEPSLSRWLSTDPLAEKYQGFSPYNYTLNNPINLVDPDGMQVDDWIKNKDTGKITWVDSSGDDAISDVATLEGKKTLTETLTETVKSGYKNLGGSFFYTKGEDKLGLDDMKMKKIRSSYLNDCKYKLQGMANYPKKDEMDTLNTDMMLSNMFMGTSYNVLPEETSENTISQIISIPGMSDFLKHYNNKIFGNTLVARLIKARINVSAPLPMLLETTMLNESPGPFDFAKQKGQTGFLKRVLPLIVNPITISQIKTHSF